MTVEEKLAEHCALAEQIDQLATQLDAKRETVRASAEALFVELVAAQKAGDLSLEGRIYKRLAAHFSEAGCHGDAQTFRLNARDCTAELRRRNWVEQRKGQRR